MTVSRYLKAAPLLAIALTFSPALPSLAQATESTVVYVSSGDVVVKTADGKLLNYSTPSGTMVSVGGKQVPASGLKPGAKVGSVPGDPKPVTGISVETGKVYQIDPPDKVTLTLAQGIKELSVPAGTTFTVGGKPVSIGQLQKGMEVTATVVTVGSTASTPPATPPQSGTILLAVDASAADPNTLPEAGTNLPLIGVLGLFSIVLGLGLRSKTFSRNNS
jgi:hypothetical protein